MIRYRNHRLLVLFSIAVILLAQVRVPAQARQEPALPPSVAGLAAPAMSGKRVGVAHILEGADRVPAPQDAAVADARVPGWSTRYGTVAGRELLPPRNATFEAAPQGPAVPLGAWRTVPFGEARRTNDIVAAPDGRVFMAAFGLLVYAPTSDGSYSLSTITASPGGLASNNISALVMNGWELYIGTNAGLNVLDLRSNNWRIYTTANSGLPSNFVTTLTNASNFVNDTLIWIGTSNGAARYDRDPDYGEDVSALPQLAGQTVRAIGAQIVNHRQTFWFALEASIARYDSSSFTDYDSSNTGACRMDSASTIVVDHSNNLWFAASQYGPALTGPEAAAPGPETVTPDAQFGRGVCRYDTAAGTWQLFDDVQPGLPTRFVSDLTVDAYNRVWISFADDFTLPGGVAVYDQGTWRIFRKSTDPLLASSIDAVEAVGDAIWIGYVNTAGVSYYTPNWQDFSSGASRALLIEADTTWAAAAFALASNSGAGWSFYTLPGNDTFSAVTAIARDTDGTLWIATAGSGLFTFDGTVFTHQTTADGLPSNDVRALYTDAAGRFWAATGGGLALHGKGYWLTFNQANSGLRTDNLRALTGDAQGRLWIGTADKGISIFNPGGRGRTPWQAHTTANGLPADAINALTTDPSGTIWAATAAGVAQHQAGTWTAQTTGEALSIASDPAGRIWAGTSTGLMLREGAWTAFHVTGSMLRRDRVLSVASDGVRTWAGTETGIAARGVLTGPIGFFPPAVASFTPSEGAPGTVVTISGSHFDDRSPELNSVLFSDSNGTQSVPALVLSASETQLTVSVPRLARTGKILVRSHGLNDVSDATFTIVPAISSLNTTCLGLGSTLTVYGGGFTGTAPGDFGTYIQIGVGPWRLTDAADPTTIRQFIRPGDTAGLVRVRLGQNGSVATSAIGLTIAVPQVDQVAAQQAVQGLQMVWGKRTLVQLVLRATGGCSAHIDGGYLEWLKKDGSTVRDDRAWAAKPAGLTVPTTVPPISLATTAAFVAGKDFTSVPFPLSQFAGMRLHLVNGPVEVVTYEIPAAPFSFIDTGTKRRILNVQVYPEFLASNANQEEFMRLANTGLDASARLFPMKDMGTYYGPDHWMSWSFRTIGRSSPVNLDSDDQFSDLTAEVDDLREEYSDGGGGVYRNAVAIVDQNLYPAGGPSGKATYSCSNPFGDCDQPSTVAFNLAGTFVGTYLQEIWHTTGWVAESSPNHSPGNKTHSKYDENQTTTDCALDKTYRQALLDQVGYVARVVKLDWGAEPVEFMMTGCSPSTQPRSVMSYAPGGTNDSSFLEPIDYNHMLAVLQLPTPFVAAANWSSVGGGVRLASSAVDADQTFRLAGLIASDVVTITRSTLLGTDGELSPASSSGNYHLRLVGANGAELLDYPFEPPATSSHGPLHVLRFSVRVPFPAGTARAELRHANRTIWSQVVPAGIAAVAFTSPEGGTYAAGGVVPVTWTATHPQKVVLRSALDYSSDNGATWQVVATGLTGATFQWRPGFIPPGTQARLRLRTSDGFHVTTVVSPPFALTPPAPVAIIHTPEPGMRRTEGDTLALAGGAMTADGPDVATYRWLHNGAVIGETAAISYTLDEAGAQVFTLEVTSHGLTATQAVTVAVEPDYAHTGIPQAWLLTYRLNPLDPDIGATDPISKGLTVLQQYWLGLNPLVADSDGDGNSDVAEIAAGLDPVVPSAPLTTRPVLSVGAEHLGFEPLPGGRLTAPWKIWVTNGGAGNLTWSAKSNADWLRITPASGKAPAQVTISAVPSGLQPGTYQGKITFTSAQTPGISRVIDVTLTLDGSVRSVQVFLPQIRR